MEEKNKHILDKALEQLPQFKADDRIWDKVVEQLDNEEGEQNPEILKRSINQLPSFRAGENIWNNIEKELDGKSSAANKFYFLKIAASLILLIGIGILINNMFTSNTQKDNITFSQEAVSDNTTDLSSTALEMELNDLIKQQCRIQPDICMNPVFNELKEELSGLTRSLEQVKTLSKNSANDPETYKYILRIQKEKAAISKKLLQFFNS